MKTFSTVLAIAALGLPFAGAQATVIDSDVEYTLNNHPDGAAASPFYGLRLDGLVTGDDSDIYTFDFEAAGSGMTMIYSAADATISIMGTAFGGQDAGSDYAAGTTALWDIAFLYTGVSVCGSGLCASDGTGTVSSELGGYNLVAESGNHSYAFQLNTGHRGFTGISGWGWLNHCDQIDTSRCDTHLYASDWLFTAEPKEVPAPATLLLLGLGLVSIGARRRAMAG
ncbi:MAG: PEP-CTERM sorting domain-containing protein [Pseudomonadota bacterium]